MTTTVVSHAATAAVVREFRHRDACIVKRYLASRAAWYKALTATENVFLLTLWLLAVVLCSRLRSYGSRGQLLKSKTSVEITRIHTQSTAQW